MIHKRTCHAVASAKPASALIGFGVAKAEGARFELANPFGLSALQADALGHYATLP